MKAIRFHEFGAPEVLRYEDAPLPVMGPGEVLVRVRAAGLNPPDWYLREGYKALPPEWRPSVTFPATPGSDVSGIVEKVADDVTAFTAGDEVFGMIRFPSFGESLGYAEYVSAPVSDLAIKPRHLDHIQAAAVPMSGLTAWQFLIDLGHDEQNPLQPERHAPVPLAGKTVVINGAAGGVGHLALQLAKHEGARVIAVASSRHEAFLRELGADEFIDYTQTKPEDDVRDVDLVVDAVGGPAASRFLQTIRPGGALFPIFPLGFAGHDEAADRGVTVSATQVRSNGDQLAKLARLLDSGAVRVAVDSTYPLSEAAAAHHRAEAGHIQGKIVLTIGAAAADQSRDTGGPSSQWPPRVRGH
ncbi:NADP-dependent oxidoreductase [Rhizobium pusense]|jgi:NADPH:quinone reductase-like Zn-dependent oxidoreductase|nr:MULTISPECIES: NADP-dependent oxidoreductase [Alphaproteobacteria]MDH0908510.1 NADP-dependent oxidoreductase [Agrobacterium pusense]MDH1094342.1 NADP-dependent oxidoreductase [Agrobacterium pusense]MDH1110924.1 NADP-dependent oxidoreductase [Agrobacterium pusense]MDH2192072.1 NADP-dependent oxidoreductase [Agrobacterium pusense]